LGNTGRLGVDDFCDVSGLLEGSAATVRHLRRGGSVRILLGE
jgi:hypothetical protein